MESLTEVARLESERELLVAGSNIRAHRLLEDEWGDPGGGYTVGVGLTVVWQDGPLGRGEDRAAPNGASVDDLIVAAMLRLEDFQGSRFRCEENRESLEYLLLALESQRRRTADRERRDVEGTMGEC